MDRLRTRRRPAARAALAVLLALLTSVGFTVAAGPAEAALPVSDNLVAAHSGQCLDIGGGSKANGAPVVQWDCLGEGQTNQRFVLQAVQGLICLPGTGCTPQPQRYTILARHSAKCLAVENASTAPGARLVQWDCNWQGNQMWTWAA